MIEGRIIKAYSGFYYVKSENHIYTCKARGLFKHNKLNPVVGDMVYIEKLLRISDNEVDGNIIEILDRKSILKRPEVANVDIAVVVFSSTFPKPKFSLIDKYLIELEKKDIKLILCFNKVDLADESWINKLMDIYEKSDIDLIFTSSIRLDGTDELKNIIKGKMAVFTGPSGVGKSSIINNISGGSCKIGELSNKTNRGKQTTRHYEIFIMPDNTMLIDTPGFTSLNLSNIEYYDLKNKYLEFVELSCGCKFGNKCLHYAEPDCMVKEAVKLKKLNKIRYESYLELLNEIKKSKR